jgi:hypothetical protein
VATSPLLNHIDGVYCEDGDIAALLTEKPVEKTNAKIHQGGVQPYSLGEANAKRLWKLIEEMTGIRFEVN